MRGVKNVTKIARKEFTKQSLANSHWSMVIGQCAMSRGKKKGMHIRRLIDKDLYACFKQINQL